MVKRAEPGDLVSITTRKGKEQGVLLESHEPGVILLKLESGYNIGLKKDDVKKITLKEKAVEKPTPKVKAGKGKPRIDIIMIGGTISSGLDVKTGGVKWLTSPSEFFRFYPGIFELADIKIHNPFMKASENLYPSDWQRVAKVAVKSLNDPNVQGVIITAGTDFLHYLSAALSFFIQDLNKPLVLTYAQRSSDRGSSDAALNLECAARAALSDIAEVMIVGHANSTDDLCYALPGAKTRKMHTSRRDAFKSINAEPIAKITREGVEVLNHHHKRNKHKAKLDAAFDDKVALIKFYPGQDPAVLEWYAKKYKGLIIEASGLGHVLTEGNRNWIPTLRKIIGRGTIVCATPQTLYGRLDPLVYSPGRQVKKLGVIYLEDMLPETALVKLGWVLGHKGWKAEEKMLENVSGELNPKLGGEFV